ncbi:MAG: hypothetical protein V3S01_09585 [Dehalococcoidia bacterium]
MLALARGLGITRRDAVGLLELLWNWAWEQAPEGDIGRWADEDIAMAVDEPAERGGEVVSNLTRCGWVDHDSSRRLVIHDYAEHLPEFMKKRLRRMGAKTLQNGDGGHCPDNGSHCPDSGRTTADRVVECSVVECSQVEPSEAGIPSGSLVHQECTELASGFELAWGVYPHTRRRSVKAKSLERWRRYKLATHAANVLAWVDACSRDEDWLKGGGEFVPWMQVWLGKMHGEFHEPPPPAAAAGPEAVDYGPDVP